MIPTTAEDAIDDVGRISEFVDVDLTLGMDGSVIIVGKGLVVKRIDSL